jgi:DivIVA domain-containing protein
VSEQKGESLSASTITSMAIRNFDPPKVLRGYDPERVDAFLKEVANRFESAVNEIVALQRRLREFEVRPGTTDTPADPDFYSDLAATIGGLELELESFRQREEAVGAALVAAQQSAAEIRAAAEGEIEALRTKAQEEADQLVSEARVLAQGIADDASTQRSIIEEERAAVLSEAQKEGDRLVSEARLAAQQIEDDASTRRSTYEEELERLRLLHETTRQDLSNFLLESLQRLTEPADEGASTARTAKSNDS